MNDCDDCTLDCNECPFYSDDNDESNIIMWEDD